MNIEWRECLMAFGVAVVACLMIVGLIVAMLYTVDDPVVMKLITTGILIFNQLLIMGMVGAVIWNVRILRERPRT